jgi:hypothetical protein
MMTSLSQQQSKLHFIFFCVRMTANNKDQTMRLTTLLLLCSILVGCEKELPVYSGETLERDGLFYKPNSNEPLTARVELYRENGQLKQVGNVVNGKREGLVQWWHDNGQLSQKATYVNGKREGLYQKWHKNGQLWQEATYVNGNEEGWRFWDENGQQCQSLLETFGDGC